MTKRKNKKVTANRNYKDTVFRKLFSDRRNLLSLYNAINGTAYTDETKLEIVTLENAIYMGMKNALAFIIDTNLFLYEHQSTYNPNMPLRDLFYISGEYQKLVDRKSLYSSILLKLPAPNFIVFYNGKRKMPDRWTNCLSESYENQQGEPNLELKVVTININKDCNRKLMEQCRILGEYAQYVEKVRENAEIITMSRFEYDKEEEEQKLQATYEKIGEKRGEKQGELKKAKSIAISLAQEGEPVERIARTLGETEKRLKNGWLKRIKIGSAVSSIECYCGTFLYSSAILAG